MSAPSNVEAASKFEWKLPALPEAPSRWARITDFLDERGVHIALIGAIALSAMTGGVLFFLAFKGAAIFAFQVTILVSLIQVGIARAHNKKMETVQAEHGYTPLHYAVIEKNYVRIQRLLERGEIDLNVRSKNGQNPLHLAVLKDDQVSAALLSQEDDNRNKDASPGRKRLVDERVGRRGFQSQDPIEGMAELEKRTLDLQEQAAGIEKFSPLRQAIEQTESLGMLSLLKHYKAKTTDADKAMLATRCSEKIRHQVSQILNLS